MLEGIVMCLLPSSPSPSPLSRPTRTPLNLSTDLMCMSGSTGKIVEPHDPGDIVTGDRIKCEVNFDQVHDPEVAEKIGLVSDSFLYS